ncbi:hypothetical protein JR316_0001677 [Psilocybe cubensis]|uniref:Uncharacterized protein n=2 Tax=Psilocybe cubensis TaxID=181762 RepID=A0ACB8HC89_PSICU|nr:hypothetical protein JR316_0001677 [Psilocybe cubensis]KAH9484775.1 hypothetical protein JR316_0001677 [Psilocybe cubensis]
MLSSRPMQFPMDGVSIPARTPGRALKARSENAHAMTVNGKGKNVAPKTPFHPASAHQKIVLATTGRPLGDKTPMPNRIGALLLKTPLPGATKPSKLKGEENGSGQRPSSMRKHIKQPRMSGKALETPINTGNHWDISDGDIVLEATAQLQETIPEQEDDFDDVEYGPPNTLDIPFQPSYDFDLPDYKQLGKTLFQLAHSVPYEDVSPPDEPIIQLESANWNMIHLPELESDDPFVLARLESKPTVPVVPSYLRSKRPQSSLARKAPSSTSSLAPKAVSKVLTRPPTSVAARPRVAPTSTSMRRPHTSQAVTSSARVTAKNPPVRIVDDVLIKTSAIELDEEFDFKFQL